MKDNVDTKNEISLADLRRRFLFVSFLLLLFLSFTFLSSINKQKTSHTTYARSLLQLHDVRWERKQRLILKRVIRHLQARRFSHSSSLYLRYRPFQHRRKLLRCEHRRTASFRSEADATSLFHCLSHSIQNSSDSDLVSLARSLRASLGIGEVGDLDSFGLVDWAVSFLSSAVNYLKFVAGEVSGET